ncbi:putative Protein phosphatase 2C [Blattamonas nauphoetae]|uniref:PPM-type phosphatase domain-containing protein n=1 Tax=Blattamonas nauphoetae TaxID=2049346 RepID=A0ABQ9XA52_9EUKA|nr:putative Protein phosphatase 2C [Blattamonas nauphoetae]
MGSSNQLDLSLREQSRQLALFQELDSDDDDELVFLRTNKRAGYLDVGMTKRKIRGKIESEDLPVDIEETISALNGEDPSNVFELVSALSRASNTEPILSKLNHYNIVPTLTRYLVTTQDEQLLYKILYLLANIAALPSDQLVAFYDDVLLQNVIRLTQHSTLDVVSEAWRLLSNLTYIVKNTNPFIDTLINHGILDTFIPSFSIIFSASIPTIASFHAPTTILDDPHIVNFPTVTLSTPEDCHPLTYLLATLYHVVDMNPQPIPPEMFTFIFSSLVTGVPSDTRNACFFIKTQQDQLLDLSSLLYQAPMPPFFPPTIPSFFHLVVAVLKHASAGLLEAYKVWTVLRLLRTQRRVCDARAKLDDSSDPAPFTQSELRARKAIAKMIDGYFVMANNVLKPVGRAVKSDDVVPFYLDAGLLPAVGICLDTFDTFQHDYAVGDWSLLELAQTRLREGSLGRMWETAVSAMQSLDLTQLATEEEVRADLVRLSKYQTTPELGTETLFFQQQDAVTQTVSFLFSNIAAGNTSNTFRLLSETFPGPASSADFLSNIAERLENAELHSHVDDLYIVHGMVLSREDTVIGQIEASPVIEALFKFVWNQPDRNTNDTAIRVFFEILVVLLQHTKRPSLILSHLDTEFSVRELIRMVRGISEQTKPRVDEFLTQYALVSKAFTAQNGEHSSPSSLEGRIKNALEEDGWEDGCEQIVLSRKGRAVRLSFDHKPDIPEEVARIESLGGYVSDKRVTGILAVARALGDFFLHPYVTADPFLTVTNISPGDEFVIIACDGV